MSNFWPTDGARRNMRETAEKMNGMAKIVFSRTLEAANWQQTRIIKDHVAEEMQKLKAQPGKDLPILGSNSLSVGLIEAGLLDEVRIMVCPVAIGRGNSLFTGLSERFKAGLAAAREFRSRNILMT